MNPDAWKSRLVVIAEAVSGPTSGKHCRFTLSRQFDQLPLVAGDRFVKIREVRARIGNRFGIQSWHLDAASRNGEVPIIRQGAWLTASGCAADASVATSSLQRTWQGAAWQRFVTWSGMSKPYSRSMRPSDSRSHSEGGPRSSCPREKTSRCGSADQVAPRRPLPDGFVPQPGSWNRLVIEVENLENL